MSWTRLLPVGWMVCSLFPLDAAESRLTYNRDIRPILVEKCFACHGPDSAARKADLRLDQRDQAIARGAITPGEPERSELLRRILSQDPEEHMPPPVTKKSLNPSEIALLREWIAQGAEYQPHWSYIPPVRPELPPVKQLEWVRNPIDRFILAQLEAKGLSPAPEADRRTLARRLSLDLIGLPPSPDDVERFVNDPAPDAYEKYVDHLMSSAHWGEHRARYWLDAARYADTHGIHFDNYREMWSYRDWVIQAFNRNLPFDQFTIEQLAGDLLPNATLDQRIASGFNRCHMTTNEGGIIDEEYLVLYTRDRTETMSQVWLGITMNCAVCHEHKFDPISQREFYELAAFFNNSTVPARDGNIKDSPPVIVVPLPDDRERWQQLESELPQARQAVEQRQRSAREAFAQWLPTATPDALVQSLPTAGLAWLIPANEGQGSELNVFQEGQPKTIPFLKPVSWQPGHVAAHALELNGAAVAELSDAGDWESDQPFSCTAWIRLSPNDSSGALLARMDDGNDFRGWDLWVEGRRVGLHLIHKWPAEALKVVTQQQVKGNEWTHVAVVYDGSRKAAGVKIFLNGVEQRINVQTDTLQGHTTRTSVPLKIGQRHSTSPIAGAAIQDIRLYHRALTAAEANILAQASRLGALLAKPAEQRTAEEQDQLYQWWLNNHDEEYRSLAALVQKLEREQADIKARGTVALVMQEKPDPPTAYVLFRGDYDKRREQVSADTPDFLPPFPADLPRNRLGLAQWLLSPEHPLTARVIVNRFWQEVFGTGLVRTSGDFGVAGELPSHPELLDWLAVEFREQGWDIRKLFKLMVTSATYRQAAITTPQKLEVDPQNRWLSRGPRFRMDAEMVRDYALTVSGLLVPKIGGPSVKPFQPDGLWEAIAMNVSNTRSYQRDVGEGSHRRSLYTFWKRQVPPAQMEIFNAPNREYCVVRRERTNTPLQALVTLNDPQFVEAAKALAQLTLLEGGATDAARLQFLGLRLLARPFRSDETAIALSSLQSLLAYYQGHLEDARQLLTVGDMVVDPHLDPAQLAAWTMLANQLMNLDEVLNK